MDKSLSGRLKDRYEDLASLRKRSDTQDCDRCSIQFQCACIWDRACAAGYVPRAKFPCGIKIEASGDGLLDDIPSTDII